MPWPDSADELEALQRTLAVSADDVLLWTPSQRVRIAGVFVAHVGDDLFAAATAFVDGTKETDTLVRGRSMHPYRPGLLALREGPIIEHAVRSLASDPDVVLVNATGRDHPRGAGLALHLGAVLDIPTVGVTDRPLVADGPEPGEARGSSAPLAIDGKLVGTRLRTRTGARAVCVHAAWRTDAETACAVVRQIAGRVRTPRPLREARRLAREARALAIR
jgi:deoxyribonuclease V